MKRILTPELMDDPSIPAADHLRALAGLARLNRIAGSSSILWPDVRRLAHRLNRPVTILDVATGSGDVPIALAKRAYRESISVELNACDMSATAIREADQCTTRAGVQMKLWEQDAIRGKFDQTYDVVTCSLFMHHLTNHEVTLLLKNLAAATGCLLLVSDLRRDPAGLALAWIASRTLTRSSVVHVDAIKSVRAAFTPPEALELASNAGLQDSEILKRWPRRMLLRWSPNAKRDAHAPSTP